MNHDGKGSQTGNFLGEDDIDQTMTTFRAALARMDANPREAARIRTLANATDAQIAAAEPETLRTPSIHVPIGPAVLRSPAASSERPRSAITVAGAGIAAAVLADKMPPRRAFRAGSSLLASMIRPPRLTTWMVPRARIEQLIDEGTAGPVTVVTGPPGAGKTTAVAAWAAARPGPVAWVTLAHDDSRPKVFWSTIVEALRNAGVTLKHVPAAPARTAAADHMFLLRLMSDLAVQDPPVVLVLDDLHQLAGAGLMDDLQYLLRNASPGLRLVICSRTKPMLPLHRYRLTGELTEIRADDLAFTVPEARLLMAQHGITLPPRTLELLTKRTEGWAAGLYLAAISIGEHPDPGQFIKGFALENRLIADYLVEEALNSQPAQSRDLLLKTSILDHVSSGIAGELTGDEQAASALEALAQDNLFIQTLGNGWYRYHSLFAEVLRHKLRLERADEVPDLHRRAARWYQANGLLLDAVRQAVAAGDFPLAAQLVVDELAIGQLIEPHDPLADCFRRMPHNPTWTGPQPALIAAALALADNQPVADCAELDVAEGILERLPADQEIPSRLAAATLRLAMARRAGDLDAAAASMARVKKLAQRLPGDILTRHAEILLEPSFVDSGRGRAESPAAGEAAPVLVEQLSKREREVLRLLSGMLSTTEVASEMYISVNTVKTHIRHIYRKLAASHRSEAVRRAEELKLI